MKYNDTKPLKQSEKEKELAIRIRDAYKASYDNKESLGLMEKWSKAQRYWKGNMGYSSKTDDPNSSTNIILPIIESQVADIVDGTMEMTIKGGPSEQPYLDEHKQRLKWVWYKNEMTFKLDEGERNRLNLGVIFWRVYYDPEALNSRGLPVIEPISPEFIFPDPKVTEAEDLYKGDFLIYAYFVSLKQLRHMFGEKAKMVQPETSGSYDPRIWGIPDNSNEIVNDQALLFEYWEMAEDDDFNLSLRRVYMAGDVILEDSDDELKNKKGVREPFYSHNKYPFVAIPCYRDNGSIWGLSDNEILWNTQETINDLDDQIKMNARLTGNCQMVVGTESGIDIKSWTNKPGLRIPARDINAIQQLNPPPMPMYINARREKAFNEAEVISGRTDVTEGRRPGSVRAASAIMALQEAGQRRAKHKKLMLEKGFVKVMHMVDSYMREFMDEEQDFDMNDENTSEQKILWSNPGDMNNIPVKTINENFNPMSDEPGTEVYKDLLEQEKVNGTPVYETLSTGESVPVMKTMTKEAEFDIMFNFGSGLPNTPSFLYQASVELAREGLITQEEARKVIKEMINWPIDNIKPEGETMGRNLSPEQLAAANGQPPAGQASSPNLQNPGQMPGQPEGMPIQGDPNEEGLALLEQAISMIDPQILQQVFANIMQGGQPQ